MNIQKAITSETAALKRRLQRLSKLDVARLELERSKLMKRIKGIDARLERIARSLGIQHPQNLVPAKKRSRTRPEDLAQAVVSALKQNKAGLTAIALSRKTGLNYASLVAWLKRNFDKVQSRGKRKERIYLVQ